MKVNKRKCRKFAVKGFKVPLNSGLLYVEKIEYIVCTAVKIIDHQKVLVIYLYLKEQLLCGKADPRWTIFHSKDDYITLERSENGSEKWRKASFVHLDKGWLYSKCAFYTLEDDERIRSFFKMQGKSGSDVLCCAQRRILEQRALKRQIARERRIVQRMKGISALPRGVDTWLAHQVMPAYFFYDYVKGKNVVKGLCSSCGKTVEIKGARYNKKGICPHCKREVTMKTNGRKGRISDRQNCQILQSMGNGKIGIRIFKVYFDYRKDETAPRKTLFETVRIFMRLEDNGEMVTENYYYSGRGLLTRWKSGNRPLPMAFWRYYYEDEKCAHVYCRNLSKVLEETPWKYCPLEKFYNHYRECMDLEGFFKAFLKHPRFEHLVKVGFYQLVSDMSYRSSYSDILDESKNRTHQILGVGPEDVSFLRELDVNQETLKLYQAYCRRGLKDRKQLLCWEKKQNNSVDLMGILQYMTPHKLMRYAEEQQTLLRGKSADSANRYSSMSYILREYKDYLDMCRSQKYDMHNSFVLYPKDLQTAHDRESQRVKLKVDAQKRRKFRAIYRKIKHQYDFEMAGMKIVYPSVPSDLAAEGQALHHCVGGYVKSVVERDCIILFLRQCENEEKPFYTIEVTGNCVAQVRGMKNCPPTKEVKAFMDEWEKTVLNRPVSAKAA